MEPLSIQRVTIDGIDTLANHHNLYRRYSFTYLRRDSRHQRLSREVCITEDSCAALLYSRTRGTVFLTRQFRLPMYLAVGADAFAIEVPAGRLGGRLPSDAVRLEIEEETGFRVGRIEEVLAAHLCPTVLTECAHLFVAEVEFASRISTGGGLFEEGEDIELLEVNLAQALAMIRDRRITDAKTIILLYHAQLTSLLGNPASGGST